MTRHTVLEVVNHDPVIGTWTVAAAFGGRTADWFQNIQEKPTVVLMVGTKRWSARANTLNEIEAESVFRDYAKEHAGAWAQLYRLILGDRFDGSDSDFARFTMRVPAVIFEPDKRAARAHEQPVADLPTA